LNFPRAVTSLKQRFITAKRHFKNPEELAREQCMTSNSRRREELFVLKITKAVERFFLRHPSGRTVTCRVLKQSLRNKISIQGSRDSRMVAICKWYRIVSTSQPLLFLVDFLRRIVKCASRIELRDSTGEMYIMRIVRDKLVVAFNINGQSSAFTVERREYVVERFTSLLYDFVLGSVTVERIYRNRQRFCIKD